MEIIVFELAKALKVPRSLPADNLQAADFQVLDGHIACNQCRAKSLGVSRNHDVKDTCALPSRLAATRIRAWASAASLSHR